MMYRVRYKPHNGAGPTRDNPYPGMAAFLLSDQARDPAVAAAKDIAAIARGTAPRSKGPGPHMADQFKVNPKSAPVSIGGNPRVGAEVYNEAEGAVQSEFGGYHTTRHRMLGKAGGAVGQWRGEIAA